ncbi:MAG: FkbM family methyltransferase [Kiritimatiellales bacterium]
MFRKIRKKLDAISVQLAEIALYEKARTLIKDNVFSIQFEDTAVKLYLPSATKDIVQKTIFQTDEFFEQNLLIKMRKYINSESVVIDAGTNIGNHTIFFSKICNAKKVHSFEPLKTVFNIFEKNLELNDIKNVTGHNVALGESAGFAAINGYNSISVGSTQFEMDAAGAFKVITLDSLNLTQVDFCKIDVEGMQLELLKGARKTLETCRPVIWIEMLNKECAMFGYNAEREVFLPQKILKELGYVLAEKMSSYDYLYVHQSDQKNMGTHQR